jgi:hypothetical protein
VPKLRESAYDLDSALEELRASGFANLDEHLGASLMEPADPDRVTAMLEHMGGRGEDPGEWRET